MRDWLRALVEITDATADALHILVVFLAVLGFALIAFVWFFR